MDLPTATVDLNMDLNMNLPTTMMAVSNTMQQMLYLVGQLLQQQQQQAAYQIALEEKWLQQQAWTQRNQVESKVPKMTSQDDPEAFLESFEQTALASRLDRSHWEGHLGVLRIGQAQAAYCAMSQVDALDYNKVKKEILYHLHINPKKYQQSF
ncbi:hypothetical protein Y1Q_0021562 [Alligator mississippiensis]|uniref:Uncharacterized protein n=1 Tax=Alligator mississippiensis TaxID=8496 RepID=A0A151PAG0_ALLMI|nr:hypothetical protein Y1Q_0021562 [Alligator mississippiensis]